MKKILLAMLLATTTVNAETIKINDDAGNSWSMPLYPGTEVTGKDIFVDNQSEEVSHQSITAIWHPMVGLSHEDVLNLHIHVGYEEDNTKKVCEIKTVLKDPKVKKEIKAGQCNYTVVLVDDKEAK